MHIQISSVEAKVLDLENDTAIKKKSSSRSNWGRGEGPRGDARPGFKLSLNTIIEVKFPHFHESFLSVGSFVWMNARLRWGARQSAP